MFIRTNWRKIVIASRKNIWEGKKTRKKTKHSWGNSSAFLSLRCWLSFRLTTEENRKSARGAGSDQLISDNWVGGVTRMEFVFPCWLCIWGRKKFLGNKYRPISSLLCPWHNWAAEFSLAYGFDPNPGRITRVFADFSLFSPANSSVVNAFGLVWLVPLVPAPNEHFPGLIAFLQWRHACHSDNKRLTSPQGPGWVLARDSANFSSYQYGWGNQATTHSTIRFFSLFPLFSLTPDTFMCSGFIGDFW